MDIVDPSAMGRSDEDATSPLLKPRPLQGPMRVAAFSALLFIVSLGFVTSYSAPATVDMQQPGSRFRDITLDQRTWIASLPPLTGVLGNAASGYVSHKLGRKAVLIWISGLYALGWLAIAYAPSLAFVYAGRLATGFSAGICSVAIPAYIVEISTVEVRGTLTSGFQVAFSLGVLLVMGLGAMMRWSWLAAAGCALVALAACCMLFMPESPAWLTRNGRDAEALAALEFLRGRGYDSAAELREVKETACGEPEGGPSLREVLEPGLYRPILIAVALMFFQQFSGINGLMSYAVELFQDTKVSVDPFLASVIAAVVQLAGASVSSLLIDRAGRRRLFITSGVFMALSLMTLGFYSYSSRDFSSAELRQFGLVPLASFVAYIAAYSVGFGPVPFVVIPELVPTRLRSLLLAVGSVSCSFFGFLVAKLFADMRRGMGLYGVYWTYCAFSALGAAYYYAFVPETKGRTVRDIHWQMSMGS